jgi:type II secretory pathway pseudopilin PulG
MTNADHCAARTNLDRGGHSQTMKPLIVFVALAAAFPALAQQSAVQRDLELIRQAQREQAYRAQQDQMRRTERARENCIANRGVDCDSEAGLQEWLILERSRAEAVLDRVNPPTGTSSVGSTLPSGGTPSPRLGGGG